MSSTLTAKLRKTPNRTIIPTLMAFQSNYKKLNKERSIDIRAYAKMGVAIANKLTSIVQVAIRAELRDCQNKSDNVNVNDTRQLERQQAVNN